ncbi:uncharacterized protein CC84DRAFT_1253930 [Paraphaeosphaeria sporulosa]|uniref:Uncharacterized protein n=1 Tax=Paraphaeosphaeria sporulosa TaxID=1460663 RepID=A0A177CVC1_9PLEO|nr:uncharacterized protein CC84DRAFT_1253930 [Paraphaeosphaeria sporulosa]OAG11473.1 hypothetical protein CC84DRAFT_1253930 [Paraphaeosphaeria sporulosa]
MPPLPGFSDNPLRTRADLIRAAIALVKPLNPYKSPGGARIKLATSTAAGFSETAAQLEGFSRPLWVVAYLLSLQSTEVDPFIQALLSDAALNLESWVQGLKEGTNPQSPEYWGDLAPFDQRMVETETIAIALLVHPSAFSFEHDPAARKNLVTWLRQINGHAMPANNWLFFRVLVNLALVLTLGVPLGEVKSYIDDALEVLDSFYLSEGWSSDGLWGAERKQADYYSGSFAMQFCALLFVKHAETLAGYGERVAKFKARAREFASEYWRYFAPAGAAIPFGRSLTYRYACGAFWSAAAYAGIDLPPPLDIGTVKGLLLRHLRWWAGHEGIFNTDGTHNIGYTYPNMYLAENYNSPQSPYWCLKALLILGLPSSSSFWTATELPHPLSPSAPQASPKLELAKIKLLPQPHQILVGAEEHHYLVSSGQCTAKRFKGREAKYGKFAYSSAFGFSVPAGPLLEQLAPDSTLAICFEGEEDEAGWKVRWAPEGVEFGEGTAEGTWIRSTWRPWKTSGVHVQTTLVVPGSKWGGWHVRVHRISLPPGAPAMRVVDGGFAIDAQTSRGSSIFETSVGASFPQAHGEQRMEGWWSDGLGSLVLSRGGASGVVDLTYSIDGGAAASDGKALIIRADPNTNLIASRTLIPAMQHSLAANDGEGNKVIWLVTGVFAVQAEATRHLERVWEMWGDRPKGRFEGGSVRFV